MYIVLDTNIWYAELGLSSARGAALKYFANQKGAVIALPEVIKREVIFNLRKSLNEARGNIDKNHTTLLSVFGRLKEVVLPTPDEIDDKVNALFDDLGVKLADVPFTLQSAERALSAVIAGEPPNGPKDQQFKDSVVWADCLELLERDHVALVTADKGFYSGRNYHSGLAPNLRAGSDMGENELTIYPSLNDLLEKITEPAQLNHEALVHQFLVETRESVDNMLERNGFAIEGDPTLQTASFVTEDPRALYVDFQITYNASDKSGAGRTNGILTLKGDAMYDPGTNAFSNIRNKGEELTFKDEDGEQNKRNVVLLAGNVVIGHRTVEHTIRHEID
ncbi:MAG: PIN domain-containing protein [Gammaproteobacteria bacterium]|nr:PIN domain-containing protein [Gammaproteobacteria bacterium]